MFKKLADSVKGTGGYKKRGLTILFTIPFPPADPILVSQIFIHFLRIISTRKSTTYTIKYTFKRQSLESSAIMRIGLYCKNVSSVDNDTIMEEDRSLRIINKFLYSLTKPVEVCTTMAAYLILTDGALFESSHRSSVDLSPMHLYWDRPPSMADICYIDCVELYHTIKTKGKDVYHWVKNSSSERKVLIITGRQLPNLARPFDRGRIDVPLQKPVDSVQTTSFNEWSPVSSRSIFQRCLPPVFGYCPFISSRCCQTP
ncbi:hypothetical protein BJ741DRAFT_683891 [Chytriomyces cf. hyalinus JEL632]|nr:hypothetical protein BJ741DRAFT_683891 [Chytriomyces cf. hyalinus JEL632]